MNHFGVRQDRVAPVADPGALFIRRIAVIGCRLDLVDTQRAKGTQLVLRQCLGREQQQRRGTSVALGRSFRDGDLITE